MTNSRHKDINTIHSSSNESSTFVPMTTPLTSAEKQLITSLAWFRSRYALFMGFSLDQQADPAHLEAFGKTWIGSFKEDWEDAFHSLTEKNIIALTDQGYALTDYGNRVKNETDLEIPFYKYEYDNYFQLENSSQVHALFCERVYGKNLSQHGLIDQEELSLLVAKLQERPPGKVLDMGCGNGRITEWIAAQTSHAYVGMDISSEAITYARQRTAGNAFLHFETGNMNQIPVSVTYDNVLFLDTLYYANNLKETIRQAVDILNDGGAVYAYFSQWIMDEAYRENLQPDNTHLAKVLQELLLEYTFTSLTESGIRHWKKKLEVLQAMEQDFRNEGSRELWEYREREARRYAHWGDQKYARYLYEIKK